MQHALRTEGQPAERFVRRKCRDLRRRHQPRRGRRPPRPRTPAEALAARAKAAREEVSEVRRNRRERQAQQGGADGRPAEGERKAIKEWQKARWKAERERSAQGKHPPAWKTPWKTHMPGVHASLRRAESTMATLLRTEAVGFNDFLYRVGVPRRDRNAPAGGSGRPRSM
jgi:hypothetical protein